MLLDMFTEVYIWIGREANEEEKRLAKDMAQAYVQMAPDGRSLDTPIIQVSSANEPLMFTSAFPAWDKDLVQGFVDPYEAKLAELKKKEAESEAAKMEEIMGQPTPRANYHIEQAMKQVEILEKAGKQAEAAEMMAKVMEEQAKSYMDARKDDLKRDPANEKFSLEDIKSGAIPGLDATKKESYLSDADFLSIMGMEREAYDKLAQWKKNDLKKKNGLF